MIAWGRWRLLLCFAFCVLPVCLALGDLSKHCTVWPDMSNVPMMQFNVMYLRESDGAVIFHRKEGEETLTLPSTFSNARMLVPFNEDVFGIFERDSNDEIIRYVVKVGKDVAPSAGNLDPPAPGGFEAIYPVHGPSGEPTGFQIGSLYYKISPTAVTKLQQGVHGTFNLKCRRNGHHMCASNFNGDDEPLEAGTFSNICGLRVSYDDVNEKTIVKDRDGNQMCLPIYGNTENGKKSFGVYVYPKKFFDTGVCPTYTLSYFYVDPEAEARRKQEEQDQKRLEEQKQAESHMNDTGKYVIEEDNNYCGPSMRIGGVIVIYVLLVIILIAGMAMIIIERRGNKRKLAYLRLQKMLKKDEPTQTTMTQGDETGGDEKSKGDQSMQKSSAAPPSSKMK